MEKQTQFSRILPHPDDVFSRSLVVRDVIGRSGDVSGRLEDVVGRLDDGVTGLGFTVEGLGVAV